MSSVGGAWPDGSDSSRTACVTLDIDESVLDLIPSATAHRYGVVPLGRDGTFLTIGLSDPINVRALDVVRSITGCDVRPVVVSEAAVLAALKDHYPVREGDGRRYRELEAAARELGELGGGRDVSGGLLEDTVAESEVITFEATAHGSPVSGVVRFVNVLLMSAIRTGASDVHVEPYERTCRIRFRLDGVLHETLTLSAARREPVVSRLKVMARLDIAERRLPQDGRMRVRVRDGSRLKDVDLRVSTLPTLFGEKVVLRLLDRAGLVLDLSALGLEETGLRRLEEALGRAWGMVLVTGPTGSGKTTTLYSAVARLNGPGTNIMTAEDPVEFNMLGVNQVQIHEAIGLNFAAALRAFLRQDPNVILVGEVRDSETAEVAVKAALTGHLVLSTVHTNDAPSAITRLVQMGIEPFLVSSCVRVVCAQRLVRRVCPSCAQPSTVSREVLTGVGFSAESAAAVKLMVGRGCSSCRHSGYRGRVGLFEVMVVTDALRTLTLQGASSHALRRLAITEGMLSLRQSGLEKIAAGLTTIDEVTRETDL